MDLPPEVLLTIVEYAIRSDEGGVDGRVVRAVAGVSQLIRRLLLGGSDGIAKCIHGDRFPVYADTPPAVWGWLPTEPWLWWCGQVRSVTMRLDGHGLTKVALGRFPDVRRVQWVADPDKLVDDLRLIPQTVGTLVVMIPISGTAVHLNLVGHPGVRRLYIVLSLEGLDPFTAPGVVHIIAPDLTDLMVSEDYHDHGHVPGVDISAPRLNHLYLRGVHIGGLALGGCLQTFDFAGYWVAASVTRVLAANPIESLAMLGLEFEDGASAELSDLRPRDLAISGATNFAWDTLHRMLPACVVLAVDYDQLTRIVNYAHAHTDDAGARARDIAALDHDVVCACPCGAMCVYDLVCRCGRKSACQRVRGVGRTGFDAVTW